MNAKQCVAILDGLQAKHRQKLQEAATAAERARWEGFLSALTTAAIEIENADKRSVEK